MKMRMHELFSDNGDESLISRSTSKTTIAEWYRLDEQIKKYLDPLLQWRKPREDNYCIHTNKI